jgi:uncharacterized protein (TIGR00295 family)
MTCFNKKDALALLEKYGADRRVMEHVMAVHDYAMEIAGRIECDRCLVEAGALLHDIGRTRSHGLDHAIIGAAILRKEGVDERIIRIVESHIGAGLTPVEAEKLRLPPGDYVPETIEEKIVCHADNLIGGTERVSIQDTIAMAQKKWFPESVERLISMHFEVFRPDVVIIRKNASQAIPGGFKDIEKFLDKQLKAFDLLYKVRLENGASIVLLFGQDSDKAAKYLVAKGIAERL